VLSGPSDIILRTMLQNTVKTKTARVIAQYRGRYRVLLNEKESWAEVTGKIIYAALSQLDFPVVGDLVDIIELDDDNAVIRDILPRKSLLKRKAAGKDQSQPIAANVNTAFIVQALDRDFNLNRFERYFTIVKAGGINPLIVLNKTDLISKEELEEKISLIKDRFQNIDVVAASAEAKDGIDDLLKALKKGELHCFVGSSGVGKSSLINKLLGKEVLKTIEISASTKKGKHTTTHRELFALKDGSMVIDNPGMREVGVGDSLQAVSDVFSDIAELEPACKFTDCTHEHEAGCAVLSALKEGQLSRDQYSNYIRLKKESAHYAMSGLEKRQKDKRFGKMVKTVKQIKGIK